MPHEKVLQKCYSGTEVAALAVRQIVMHLLDIVSAAAATPVPQQWIGSSIALAFDAGKRPERNAHGGHPLVANVKIFDWGRSELASFDMFNVLSSNQQRSRASHWAQWIGGALRLSFEAARFYRRQYCPSGKKWTTVKFEVWSHTKNNDITTFLSTRTGMGVATIDLSSAPQNEEIELALLPPGVLRGATIIKTVGATVNTVKRIGLSRASSDSITGWDLAAGSGGDFRAALRLWKALFFFAGQANTNNGLPHLGVDDQLEAMLFQSMKSFDDTTTAPTIIPTDSNSGTGSPRMRGHSGFSAVNDNIVKELAPEASEEHKCDQTRFSDNLAEKEVDTPPHTEVKRGDSPLVSVVSSAFGREPQVSSPLEDKLRETEILLEKELRRSSALQEEEPNDTAAVKWTRKRSRPSQYVN
eukprot:gene13380-20598_t